MEQFAKVLFQVLRRMDSEAGESKDGYPTGLNWYGGYHEPSKKRPRTEVSWSQRLAQLLPEHGYPTAAEVPYPHRPRTKCDNVVTCPNGAKLWLENKGAWKSYWMNHGKLITYRSYLLHPLVPGLDASKTHTCPFDLRKLEPLRPPIADYVALLLIGFDREGASMTEDVDELVRLAHLDCKPWVGAADHWPDKYRANENVHCWLWYRAAGAT